MKGWKIAVICLSVISVILAGVVGNLFGEKNQLTTQLVELQNQNKEIKGQKEKWEGQYQCLKETYDNLKTSPAELSSREVVGECTDEELKSFLKERYPNIIVFTAIDDFKYQLVSLEYFKSFLAKDDTDHYSLVEDDFDCMDFAIRLKAQAADAGILAVGIIAGDLQLLSSEKISHHAFNIFVTKENGKLVLYEVEPQWDGFRKLEKPFSGSVDFFII